jgi:hypothetical protein
MLQNVNQLKNIFSLEWFMKLITLRRDASFSIVTLNLKWPENLSIFLFLTISEGAIIFFVIQRIQELVWIAGRLKGVLVAGIGFSR